MMASPVGFSPSGSFPFSQHATHLKAFNFKLADPLPTLEGLKVKLTEHSELKNWYSESKSFIGDFISTVTKSGSTVRIFETKEGFDFDFLNKTLSEEDFQADLAQFKGVLETLGATDFNTAEDYY